MILFGRGWSARHSFMTVIGRQQPHVSKGVEASTSGACRHLQTTSVNNH
jgi:hypothetical protein